MCDETVTITLPIKVAVQIVQHGVLIEKHNIGRDTFYTTALFWDCECDDNYIFPIYLPMCGQCASRREDQPNARVEEVLRHRDYLPDELVQVVEMLVDKICPHFNAIPF